MGILAIGIEPPHDVTVQRLHDRDPRQHLRPVALGDEQQRFHRDFPVGGVVLGFRQFGDVLGGDHGHGSTPLSGNICRAVHCASSMMVMVKPDQ